MNEKTYPNKTWNNHANKKKKEESQFTKSNLIKLNEFQMKI